MPRPGHDRSPRSTHEDPGLQPERTVLAVVGHEVLAMGASMR